MPSFARYRFVGKTPWPFLVAFWAFAANFVAVFVLMASYTLVPDAVHSCAIRHKGGFYGYYRPLVGHYVEIGFWGHFVLLALVDFIQWCYRDRVQKVEPPPARPSPWSSRAFLASLILSSVLLSLVGGFVAGILWQQGEAGWAAGSALPFFAIVIFAGEYVRSEVPDDRRAPLSPGLSRGLALLLSAATIAGIAWWWNQGGGK